MRRTPLKPSTKPMRRSGFKPRALLKPTLAAAIGKTQKIWKKAKPSKVSAEAALCRGQDCYLLLPGIQVHERATVVPCHSNQAKHGKGMGIKADDKFTVPGCWLCHRELDQGARFTKEEKFAFWDAAYARWEPVRDRLMTAGEAGC